MILVTGASGFVGGKILQMRQDAIASPSLRGMGEDDIKRMLERFDVDAVIHTAAISDTRVCQANPDESYRANVQIPMFLASALKDTGIKLVCFSSDQVYTGTKEVGPFTEEMAKPANVYAEHKLEMEERVLDLIPSAVMLRAEWMYDYYLKKPNYFMNVISATDTLRFSSSVYRGVTYVKEVVENIDGVMRLPGGVYNFGSETAKSIYEVTYDFLKLIGKDVRVDDVPVGCDLWMNCSKAKKHGIAFSSVEDGLKRCAEDYDVNFTRLAACNQF